MTVLFVVSSTVQFVPLLVSHPSQPPNVETPLGVAVNVTLVSVGNVPLQDDEQPMPTGELVTVPVPVFAKSTVSAGCEAVP